MYQFVLVATATRAESAIIPIWLYRMKCQTHGKRIAEGRWERFKAYLCVLIQIKTIDSGHLPKYNSRGLELGELCSAIPFSPLAKVTINQIAHEELKKWPRWKTVGYQ